MTRVKETIERHDKGYNCAQSVACTYADLVGLDEATMFKVTEGTANWKPISWLKKLLINSRNSAIR